MTDEQANILIEAVCKAKAVLRGLAHEEENWPAPEAALQAISKALETEPVDRVLKELGSASSDTALESDAPLAPSALTEGT